MGSEESLFKFPRIGQMTIAMGEGTAKWEKSLLNHDPVLFIFQLISCTRVPVKRILSLEG